MHDAYRQDTKSKYTASLSHTLTPTLVHYHLLITAQQADVKGIEARQGGGGGATLFLGILFFQIVNIADV